MKDVFEGHDLAIPFRPVADLLDAYAARDPRKTAIVDLDGEARIDFGDLRDAANRVAARLVDLGVGRGDRVLLLSDECLEKLILWLGVWRIGAVVCPLNIELNTKHLGYLSNLIGPKVILIQEGLELPEIEADAPIFRFGTWAAPQAPAGGFFASLPAEATSESLPHRYDPADLSCMFCTSGTTSLPKIVVYDHAAYWLSGLSTLDMLGLTEEDRTLEYRSFGWNSAQILSWMPFLQTGLTLHIAKRFSHSRFFDWVRENGITFSAGVPTVVNILLNKPLGVTAEDVPTLKRMTCSTAPLSPQQWDKFEQMYGLQLLQLYGMSEAGWICGNRHYRWRRGTVGPAAYHQEFKILDGEGNECPPGVEGETSIAGPQTAIGTLREDGSIEPIRGRRIRTGDLAVMDDEGFVTVTGRTKDLIIRGGMNIAPTEIDNVLMGCDFLLEGAAFGIEDAILGEEVACAVIPKEPGITAERVQDYCRQHLPQAKVPKRVLFPKELPKSDRGKVLRAKLQDMAKATA